MTDDMAMKIVSGSRMCRRQSRARAQLKVVVAAGREPDDGGGAAARAGRGVHRPRADRCSSKHAPDEFIWVMNRDAFYRLRAASELDVDLGPSPDAINPEYALTATFSSLTNEDRKRRSEYYLCVYELTDLSDRNVLWTDQYEVKKKAVKEFLD